MTRLLVFQHHTLEHPGTFRDFLAADGAHWDTVRLDRGEAIPSMDGYDALVAMGGPQDIWQEDRFPWLVAEKAAIREAVVEREMAFLGICLGHQLLASALGGKVALMKDRAEIGVREVELTSEGENDPLLSGLPPAKRPSAPGSQPGGWPEHVSGMFGDGKGRSFWCLQWHGAEVNALPEGAVTLARNAASPIQAFRYGERAYGLQFHVEAAETTVSEWASIPAYKKALERGLDEGELPLFEAEVRRRATEFRASAKRLYDRFKALVAASAR